MDVFDRVMLFMQDTNLKPSEELIKFYARSEATKILTEIPSFMDLKEKIGMKREVYDKLKERYKYLNVKIKHRVWILKLVWCNWKYNIYGRRNGVEWTFSLLVPTSRECFATIIWIAFVSKFRFLSILSLLFFFLLIIVATITQEV